jgi:hypothetical protein
MNAWAAELCALCARARRLSTRQLPPFSPTPPPLHASSFVAPLMGAPAVPASVRQLPRPPPGAEWGALEDVAALRAQLTTLRARVAQAEAAERAVAASAATVAAAAAGGSSGGAYNFPRGNAAAAPKLPPEELARREAALFNPALYRKPPQQQRGARDVVDLRVSLGGGAHQALGTAFVPYTWPFAPAAAPPAAPPPPLLQQQPLQQHHHFSSASVHDGVGGMKAAPEAPSLAAEQRVALAAAPPPPRPLAPAVKEAAV